ncbi:MAG TPA: Gldg family protein [Acidimicrobiales bacterium]|nr:Gldg family protein [Acidimicrobiales bacterium]
MTGPGGVWTVLSKDLRVLWASALPWVVGALLQAVLGLLYVNELTARGQALVQPMVPLAGFLLVALVPILTMRAFAEERRQGTLDLLLAIPASASGLVMGKWLASWATAVAVLAPVFAVVGVLFRIGEPDPGTVVAGAVGLLLLAAMLAGVGTCASACTTSQPVAAVVAFFSTIVLWFAHTGSETLAASGVLVRLSISERLRTFAGGGIDSGDVAFLIATTIVSLLGATVAVRRRHVGRTIVAVVAVVGLAVALDVSSRQLDLTQDRTLTLSSETKEILRRVREPVRVTVFLDRADPTRVVAPTLLSRYRRLNPHISFRLRDPQSSPAEMRRLGVDPSFGGLAVDIGGEIEVAPSATEQDITAALARGLRGAASELCVSTGHGENDQNSSAPEGLAMAAQTLRDNGYLLRSVDLLTTTSLPSSCAGLLIASPTSPLGASSFVVASYLDAGGRAVVLLDPASTIDLADVLGPYGLATARGLVLEGDAGDRFSDDPFRPVVHDYRSGNPIVRRLAPTFFPAAQAIVVHDDAAVPGLSVTGLAYTSKLSFLETEPSVVEFDPAKDLAGPIAIVAAADRSSAVDGGVHRTRLVVVGDVDFATNDFVGEAANGELLVRSVDWVTLEESAVTVSSNVGRVRELHLTEGRLGYLRMLSTGILPALFLVLGALTWTIRRSH